MFSFVFFSPANLQLECCLSIRLSATHRGCGCHHLLNLARPTSPAQSYFAPARSSTSSTGGRDDAGWPALLVILVRDSNSSIYCTYYTLGTIFQQPGPTGAVCLSPWWTTSSPGDFRQSIGAGTMFTGLDSCLLYSALPWPGLAWGWYREVAHLLAPRGESVRLTI